MTLLLLLVGNKSTEECPVRPSCFDRFNEYLKARKRYQMPPARRSNYYSSHSSLYLDASSSSSTSHQLGRMGERTNERTPTIKRSDEIATHYFYHRDTQREGEREEEREGEAQSEIDSHSLPSLQLALRAEGVKLRASVAGTESTRTYSPTLQIRFLPSSSAIHNFHCLV